MFWWFFETCKILNPCIIYYVSSTLGRSKKHTFWTTFLMILGPFREHGLVIFWNMQNIKSVHYLLRFEHIGKVQKSHILKYLLNDFWGRCWNIVFSLNLSDFGSHLGSLWAPKKAPNCIGKVTLKRYPINCPIRRGGGDPPPPPLPRNRENQCPGGRTTGGREKPKTNTKTKQ